MLKLSIAAALLLTACAPTGGGGGGGDTDGGADTDGVVSGDASVDTDGAAGDAGLDPDVLPPENVFPGEHAVNIVDPEAAAAVERFITTQDLPALHTAVRAFYAVYGDDYDFVYAFSQRQLQGTPAAVFRHAHVPDIPSVGLMGGDLDPAFGSDERLRGAVAVNFNDGGNGPTIHETAHYWGVFLDERFGFGRDADTHFGAHWGLAGVMGQLGGFDAETIECVDPAGEPPPCTVDENGQQQITIGAFGPTANGGDGIAFAPIELYLMGLVPAAEVPSPIVVIEDGHFEEFDEATMRLRFTIGGLREVSIDDIIEVHGERPPAPESDRAFRAAFVLFSDAPIGPAELARLQTWARIFGNVEPSNFLQSFESATGGRATMDVRLGSLR